MRKIRKHVFETNSSSMHSLVYSKEDRGYDYDLPVDEFGVLTIPFGEFGWGPEILRTPLEKLSYYVTDHSGYQYDDDEKPWEYIVSDVLSKPAIQAVIKLIKDKCPEVKDIKFEAAGSFYPRGYVDHESAGTSNDTELEKLIFSKSVIILIDNDNSCHYSDYRERYNWDKGEFDPPVNDIEELF